MDGLLPIVLQADLPLVAQSTDVIDATDGSTAIDYPASIDVIARIAFGNVPHGLIVASPNACGRVGLSA